MNQKSIRYNDWEIPQLIHHISSALEMSQTVDESRDLQDLNKFSKIILLKKM
jgi:hypothetical protein